METLIIHVHTYYTHNYVQYNILFCLPWTGSTSSSITCNFDANNLCTWANDQSMDQFDWQLNKGPTGSIQTGPNNDHTLGTAAGLSHVLNGFVRDFHFL